MCANRLVTDMIYTETFTIDCRNDFGTSPPSWSLVTADYGGVDVASLGVECLRKRCEHVGRFDR